MGLFRRKQATLNEQLLRQAGLDSSQLLGDPRRPVPLEPPPSLLSVLGVPYGSTAAHGAGVGANDWDTCVTATRPGLAGDRVEFTTLPNGDVIVSDETPSTDLSSFADAVERHVEPPYRAVAARHDGDLWAVGAKRIEVARIPFQDGHELELSRNGDDEELRVDGEPSDTAIPAELGQLGDAVGESFYVEAHRIDGDLWEVRAAAL